MAEEAKNPEFSSLVSELDAALATLDSALLQAGRSVAIIRSDVSQFAELADVVRELEATMARARQNLAMPMAAAPQPVTSPPLRSVPPPEPMPVPAEREPMPAEAVAPSIEREETPEPPEREAPAGEPTDIAMEPQPSAPASHCLRLSVSSNDGSLDLKIVDAAVNENPAVVDVALLDYDGRQATLKLWINEAADTNGVREALLSSLRRRLGDERDAEVSIDLEEGSAA